MNVFQNQHSSVDARIENANFIINLTLGIIYITTTTNFSIQQINMDIV